MIHPQLSLQPQPFLFASGTRRCCFIFQTSMKVFKLVVGPRTNNEMMVPDPSREAGVLVFHSGCQLRRPSKCSLGLALHRLFTEGHLSRDEQAHMGGSGFVG